MFRYSRWPRSLLKSRNIFCLHYYAPFHLNVQILSIFLNSNLYRTTAGYHPVCWDTDGILWPEAGLRDGKHQAGHQHHQCQLRRLLHFPGTLRAYLRSTLRQEIKHLGAYGTYVRIQSVWLPTVEGGYPPPGYLLVTWSLISSSFARYLVG